VVSLARYARDCRGHGEKRDYFFMADEKDRNKKQAWPTVKTLKGLLGTDYKDTTVKAKG
jgi:hypothetical protein